MGANYYFKNQLEESFYKLNESGHLFSFNFTSLRWEDISIDMEYIAAWKELTKDEIYKELIVAYQKSSQWFIEDIFEDVNEEDEIDFSNIFTYYKKNGRIICVDDKQNEFECHIGSFELLDLSVLDSSWTKLNTEDIFSALNNEECYVDLKDGSEFYLDKYNNIYVYTKDGYEFMLDTVTGYLIKMTELEDVNPSWRSIDSSYLNNLSPNISTVISKSDIKDCDDTSFFIIDFFEDIQKYNKVQVGHHIQFYMNDYEDVFMKDENGNEFSVNLNGFVFEEEGTITSSFEKIPYKDVSRLVHFSCYSYNFYQDKKIPTVYDLCFYKDDKDKIYGFDKDGKTFVIDDNGFFSETSDVGEKITREKRLNVIRQTSLTKALSMKDSYIKLCKENSEEEFGECNFFYLNDEKEKAIYAINQDGNLFRAGVSNMERIMDGVVDKSKLLKIKDEEFILYYLHVFKKEYLNPNDRIEQKRSHNIFISYMVKLTSLDFTTYNVKGVKGLDGDYYPHTSHIDDNLDEIYDLFNDEDIPF